MSRLFRHFHLLSPILVIFLLIFCYYQMNLNNNTVILDSDGKIITTTSETVPPLIIYQNDGTIVRVPYLFSSWVTCVDNGDSVRLGTLPPQALIEGVGLWVENGFNAIGTDLISVGYTSNHDAYIVDTDVSSKGIKTNNNVADGIRVGKSEEESRIIYAYYNGIESNPTFEEKMKNPTIEEFLKNNRLARIQYGGLNMSFVDDEQMFLVYGKYSKSVFVKTENFSDAWKIFSEQMKSEKDAK